MNGWMGKLCCVFQLYSFSFSKGSGRLNFMQTCKGGLKDIQMHWDLAGVGGVV